jgi:CRP-like cAMP-binding protein
MYASVPFPCGTCLVRFRTENPVATSSQTFVAKAAIGQNRILARLPEAEAARLAPYLQRVPLVPGRVYQEEGEPAAFAYFPESGLLSLVVRLADGGAVEAASVGPEGMTGLSAFLGSPSAPVQIVAQIAGQAQRLPTARLRRETTNGSALTGMLARYANARFAATAQSVACNRYHTVFQRCARWILTAHDRVSGDEFELTHEFLSMMLGVRRAGVTEAVAALARASLIQAARGRIGVVNRAGLERASCECYAVIQREMEAVLR